MESRTCEGFDLEGNECEQEATTLYEYPFPIPNTEKVARWLCDEHTDILITLAEQSRRERERLAGKG